MKFMDGASTPVFKFLETCPFFCQTRPSHNAVFGRTVFALRTTITTIEDRITGPE